MFTPFSLHYHANMDAEPSFRCESQGEVAVLSLGGNFCVFLKPEQVAALCEVLARWLDTRPVPVVPTCDLCGVLITLANVGQSTAETVLCSECLAKAGPPMGGEPFDFPPEVHSAALEEARRRLHEIDRAADDNLPF